MVFAGKDISRRELLRGPRRHDRVSDACRCWRRATIAQDSKSSSFWQYDLGYPTVSCYGRPDFSNSNMDQHHAQDCVSQAYANLAVCTARARGDHGRYSIDCGSGWKSPCAETSMSGLPRNTDLPAFEESWYGTTLIGSGIWGCSAGSLVLESGYDHFYGFRSGPGLFSHTIWCKDDLWDDDFGSISAT